MVRVEYNGCELPEGWVAFLISYFEEKSDYTIPSWHAWDCGVLANMLKGTFESIRVFWPLDLSRNTARIGTQLLTGTRLDIFEEGLAELNKQLEERVVGKFKRLKERRNVDNSTEGLSSKNIELENCGAGYSGCGYQASGCQRNGASAQR